jgi:hypothetical protein
MIKKIEQILSDLGEAPLLIPETEPTEQTALTYASKADAALRLLAAGADPAKLNREARRAILVAEPLK